MAPLGLPSLRNQVVIKAITETSVYSGVAPIAFTDLDLSSWVGTQKAIVCLRFSNSSGDASALTLQTRVNGDDAHASTTDYGPFTTCSAIADGSRSYVFAKTDANGIIEIKVSLAKTISLQLQGYIAQ